MPDNGSRLYPLPPVHDVFPRRRNVVGAGLLHGPGVKGQHGQEGDGVYHEKVIAVIGIVFIVVDVSLFYAPVEGGYNIVVIAQYPFGDFDNSQGVAGRLARFPYLSSPEIG
jgi:hypothetical protein